MLQHHASGVTEADAIRYAGAAAAFLGALIASPAGLRLLWREGRKRARQGRTWIRAVLQALLPRTGPTQGRGLADSGSADDRISSIERRLVWHYSEPVAGKLAYLYKDVETLLNQLYQVRQELLDMLSDSETAAKNANAELRAALDRTEFQTARIDARAVWLVGGGVISSAFPGGIAHFAPVGWTVLAMTAIGTLYLIWAAWNAARISVAGQQAD